MPVSQPVSAATPATPVAPLVQELGVTGAGQLAVGLAVLTVRALAAASLRNVTWRVVMTAIAISSLYGVSDEFHQRFVPGRDFDVFDMAADALGSIAGAGAMGAWSIIGRRFERRDVL